MRASSRSSTKESHHTPGVVKSGKAGQLPSWAGSPPTLTQVAWLGTPPLSTKSWNQPGGQTPAWGGAVIVQTMPEP